ncbi:MAG: hypothetical protein ABIJ92_01530 [Candidatus Aenigmatarchaeota archaeon]
MKIYLAHSTDFDYKKELYEPLKNSELVDKHEFVFPHDNENNLSSKDIIKNCNLIIADVSYPSIGVGVELGWAESFGIKIICIFKRGSRPSKSLRNLTLHFIEYSDTDHLINELKEELL